MAISFEGKTVLVSGAAGAIGARCAEELGRLGARLVLTDASAEALGAARADLPSTVDVALGLEADVTGHDAVENLRRETMKRVPALDAIILSAGIYRPAPLATMTDADWKQTLDVNLTGVFHFIRAFAPHMADAGPIDSPMVVPLMERRGAQIIADTPMKRLGTTLDVARAAAFLASEWAGHITGENLHVNGGLYMA